MNKNDIRQSILKLRKNLTSEVVNVKSADILSNLKSSNILNFNNFLIYSDFKNEVRTEGIIRFLQDNSREVYLPKCNILTKTFIPVPYNDNFLLNEYGIKEPAHEQTADIEIECAIVPGVAFDKNGNRIGFGAGYYDKFFADNPDVFKIGLCYEFQLFDKIPADCFDIPMNIIVTEKRIIFVG